MIEEEEPGELRPSFLPKMEHPSFELSCSEAVKPQNSE